MHGTEYDVIRKSSNRNKLNKLQMGQLTNAIGDDDIVKHFRGVLAPYVVETQLSPGLDSNISPTSVQRMTGGGQGRSKYETSQDFVDKISDILERALRGLTKKQVCIFFKNGTGE